MCLSDSADGISLFYLFHYIQFILLCLCCLQFILLLNNSSRIKNFLQKSTIVFEVSYYGHYETPISQTDIPTYKRASAHSLSIHISPIKIYSCFVAYVQCFVSFTSFDITSNTISTHQTQLHIPQTFQAALPRMCLFPVLEMERLRSSLRSFFRQVCGQLLQLALAFVAEN